MAARGGVDRGRREREGLRVIAMPQTLLPPRSTAASSPQPKRAKALPLAAMIGLMLTLSACAGGSGGEGERVVAPPPPPRAIRHPSPPPARLLMLPGLEGVIGATAPALTRSFGTPRLDVMEGDARKLQFVGSPCVLDVYLYPPAAGAEPRATYVDARRAGDGRDVDRAACVAMLRQAHGGR